MKIVEDKDNTVEFYSNYVKLSEEEKEEKKRDFVRVLNEIGIKNIKDTKKS